MLVNKERNYGIDLLRIVAIIYVVILHVLGRGGVLDSAIINSIQFKFVWFLEILCFCAVDIFALISGYVGYNDKEKKYNYSNYLFLWFQVVFYGLTIMLIFQIVSPSLIDKKDFIKMLFPVTNNLYWYFTAYTGLFFLIPFLNAAIRISSKKYLKLLFVILFICFSVLETLFDIFKLSKGYSLMWLIILYIMGAIIKKCEIGNKTNKYLAFILIILFTFISWILNIYGLNIDLLNIKITKYLLVTYTSPFVLGSAILYIISFSKINFNPFLKKIISYIVPSVFIIYIINCHKYLWNIISNKFIFLSNQNIFIISLYVLGISFIFIFISILIDRLRIWIFKKCKIKELSLNIVRFLNQLIKVFEIK